MKVIKCKSCKGTGKLSLKPCPYCQGTGKRYKRFYIPLRRGNEDELLREKQQNVVEK